MPNDAPSTMNNDAPIATAKMKGDISPEHKVKTRSPSTGPMAYALSIARVIRCDHTKHQVALQILQGENDVFEWTAIPNTCPVAGNRTFIGSMPEAGDVCIVGWLASESKQPVILTWLPSGVSSGMEWLPVQDFLPAEADMNPKTLAHFEGIYSRYRMKHIPVRPGTIVLSSSAGSDIILDEGVFITNRRANEIRLRDADQAIVFRSLQQFHAMGGARVYGGMVQRDAKLLPRRMFSDGIDWTAKTQQDENGNPLTTAQLGSSAIGTDELTPHPAFFRADVSQPFTNSGVVLRDNADPYVFLNRGLFIGSDGIALNGSKVRSSAEYGGKPYFRVSIDPDPEGGTPPSNGAINQDGAESDTLTEYRIELDHSWDGTLPVTEQTDGFDADRLPSDSVGSNATSAGGPFIQWVLGSVVGNDPFTNQGSQLYGLPLTPKIFDADGTVAPRLESGIGVALGEHAASLMRVDPPIADPSVLPPMFSSVTKDGRVRAFLGGPQNEDSLELACNGGIHVQSNGALKFDAPTVALNFRNGDPLENWAFKLESETGGILIKASAPTTRGSFSTRDTQNSLEENQLPSISIESPNGNVQMTAARTAKVSGANAIYLTDTNEVLIQSKQQINMLTDKALLQTTTRDKTIMGRETQLYSGPKNFLPTNAPFREVKFIGTPLTGHAGGTTDEYKLLFGDRDESIRVGDHSTTVLIGNMTYQTRVGTLTNRAGLNSIQVSTSGGITMTSVTTTSMTSTLSTTVSALASITIKAVGRAKLSGLNTTLGGIGKTGRIISSADRDPLTNRRLGTLGLGSPGHRLGAPL